jgi:hypothetical protein
MVLLDGEHVVGQNIVPKQGPPKILQLQGDDDNSSAMVKLARSPSPIESKMAS